MTMTQAPQRVLAALRLSKDQDESTSLARQREQVGHWAQMTGAVLAAESADTDVSGNVPAFGREHLGPYFRPPLVGTWDVLVVAKLDRLSRNVGDFTDLVQWASDHGKVIVSIAESFDLATPAGRMVANIMIAFAQFERERIGERCRESRAKLANLGRWGGGVAPFGYDIADGHPGKILVRNPVTSRYAREMAQRATDGDSNGKIAAWLNACYMTTSRGCLWKPETVGTVLRGHSLAGYAMRKDSRVRDADGNDVMITAEPILTDDEWRSVQAALDSRGQHRAERKYGSHQLLRVAYCRTCSPDYKSGDKPQPLYGHNAQGRNKQGSNYTCPRCGYRVTKARLEAAIESKVLLSVGDRPLPKLVPVPAISHTAELKELNYKIEDLDTEYEAGNVPAKSYGRMMAKLEAERDRLEALPQREARTEYVPTGQTVAEHWDTLDNSGRGAFLREWGVRIYADRKGHTAVMGWEDSDHSGSDLAKAFGIRAA